MRYIFGFLFVPSVLHVVFAIGIREESSRVQQASSTTFHYLSPSVCARAGGSGSTGASGSDSEEDQVNSSSSHSSIISTNEFFTTIDSRQEALSIGMDIAHCGDCGQCSTDSDIELMIATKETLTKDATICAVRGLIFGDGKIDECLQTIGFTPGCSTCWKDNIKCTRKNCVFTCLKSKLLADEHNQSNVDNDNDENSDELNACLECDEKMCGPDFLQCAGANRRRLGIVSDIKRHNAEQCTDARIIPGFHLW